MPSDNRPETSAAPAAPSISLPKGGGAIRGIGEKFATNPVTGTASLSVPIATSPGRGGFGPQLALAYDSGSGNGPFGFGWTLRLPTITRKTSKGLPRYRDAEESDVFIISDADDLVPVLEADGSRYEDTVTSPGFVIHRYRPRIEGLFARIERWTRAADGDVHWRSISRDNLLTLYGADERARVFDPDHPDHVFSWLVCETRDDKGNAIIYEYKAEDAVDVDLVSAHESNRGPADSKTRTAARHPKRIRYGNRVSLLDENGGRPSFLTTDDIANADWMFDVIFDYGEHDEDDPTPDDAGHWLCRHDPFSSYRSGFEVRTYRLCQRILMFHQFAREPDVGENCLVRSMDFEYRSVRGNDEDLTRGHPIASFIASVTQRGYRRAADGGYVAGSMPPLEFEYSDAIVNDDVREVDAESLANMPVGLDNRAYQWVDLDGEGVSGIFTEQAGAWFYKPSLGDGRFGPSRTVSLQPSQANLSGGRQKLLDLAGDGQLDVVDFSGPTPGFYERTTDSGWESFRQFSSLPNIAWDDPNLRFVDLDGDGHSDVLITDNDVFTWHPSWAEDGFGPAERVRQSRDEEHGAALVFADGTQSIYLADMTGDGLVDLVRVRQGEVCYWPNAGYGRFAAKVTMDNAPWFDRPDQFRQSGVRLADIDGSGTNDLIYIGRDGVRLFFNEAGNSWTSAHLIDGLPLSDDVSSVMTADLLGNGTAALVWSSPLPGFAPRTMRYVDLMGGQKPHLLVRVANNFGAETRINYRSSTYFYLKDKAAGEPWITRLAFPVHAVERVETWDHVSRNRFVTQYAYHHGYFDGFEREFRGFGRVDQRDTEQFAALSSSDDFPTGDNVDAASHVPPVLTKTWFHTGIALGREHVSDFFAGFLSAGDPGEYYREPGLTPAQARALLLDDTILPAGLSVAEEREACRALKGSMLRQEIFAEDRSPAQSHPYLVREHSYTVELLQSQGGNRHAVFHVHPREAIEYHYERDPTDPRVSHTLTLETDRFGNVLKSATVGYGRRQPDASLSLLDQAKQTTPLVTYTETTYTNPIDSATAYRSPLPAETSTYELTRYPGTGSSGRLQASDLVKPGINGLDHIFDGETTYETSPGAGRQRRLIECSRVFYRPDDFGVAQADPLFLLPLGHLESLALTGESYRLAFTPGLLANVYQRPGLVLPEQLIPDATVVLPVDLPGGHTGDRGGYVDLDADGHWWIPSGRAFHSPGPGDSAATERARALQHFFLPCRYLDPFGSITTVTFDAHDLLLLDTVDALGNRVTAGERDAGGAIVTNRNDYRVLKPTLVTDSNRNRTAAAFDALGFVAGTAVMGKSEETLGDSLTGFAADLTEAVVLDHLLHPLADPRAILGRATSRLVYDFLAFYRTRADAHPQPTVVYTLLRETHDADLANPGDPFTIRHSKSYSDGFGREIQKKVQAEVGPLVKDGPEVDPRWVGDGWTIYNNKGKPVRQYEPFFTATHQFELARVEGVSPILFYDPVGRVVVTLRPNHTYEKALFDPWRHESWDANDTVALDPRTDADVSGYVGAWFATQPATWKTWSAERATPALGAAEQSAAVKTMAHAGTPTVTILDTLGREFLTIADNGVDGGGAPQKYATHIKLDIEGNHREIVDALDRVVMRYDYDMLSRRIHQASMDAGERWMLSDVAEHPIRAWDSRGHTIRTEYDPLRRPVRTFMTDANAIPPNQELLVDRRIYGEQHPQGEAMNLRRALYLQLDQAGTTSTERLDFKGNALSTSRRLAAAYRATVGWSSVDAAVPAAATTVLDPIALENALAPLLEAEIFSGASEYDALNRPTTVVAPHASGAQASAVRFSYNLAGLLEQVDANVREETAAGALVWTPFVTDIDYDAKGQRTGVVYGNNVVSSYEYDPLTNRLAHVLTQRDAVAFPGDSAPPPAGWPGKEVQNLSYTYDPVGNITYVRDDAQQTIFFRNTRVEPSAAFTYDPLYRLLEATGREHLGQTAGIPDPPTAPDFRNGFHTRLDHPGDGAAMGTYLEQFVYDAVGNILTLQHTRTNPNQPGWSRGYTYATPSVLEPAKMGNQLTSSALGGGPAEPNVHDAHGNIVGMSHLSLMQRDYRDQLQASARQAVTSGTPETTWYTYDATGQRARKVTVAAAAAGQTPVRLRERIYFGGFEIYREFQNDGVGVQLERETLHVMDGPRRVAQVESRTRGNEPGVAAKLTRYVLDNHLSSASVELDERARIISYEEYFPYGSSSYQAVRDTLETPNRYRYTGQERDEETGLYYHGARYFAPWLGRWVSCDPAGPIDGTNLYKYASDNPVKLRDPTGNEPETFRLSPSLLDTRTPEERMAAKYQGSLVPPLRLDIPPDLRLPGFNPLTSAVTTPLGKFTPSPPASPTAPTKEPEPSFASHFKFKAFPPSLQFDARGVRAKADISKVSVALAIKTGTLTGSYTYGKDIELEARGPRSAGTIGVDPATGRTTFKVEQNDHAVTLRSSVDTSGTLGFGVTVHGLPTGDITADTSANVGRGSFAASLNIGLTPVPPPQKLHTIATNAYTSALKVVPGTPATIQKIVSDPSHISDTITSLKPDITNIAAAATAGSAIADKPESPTAIDLRVRFQLTVNPATVPDTTRGPAGTTLSLGLSGTF